MEDFYTVPRGVRFDSDCVRSALADAGIESFSYVANGAQNHVFLHRQCGAKLSVIACATSKRLSEVVGDTVLWLRVRKVAADAELSTPAERDSSEADENAGTPAANSPGDSIEGLQHHHP